MGYADVFNVLMALEAGTAQELSRLMLDNNLKHKKFFQYQITVKGNKFQAWFYNSMSNDERVREEMDRIKKSGRK